MDLKKALFIIILIVSSSGCSTVAWAKLIFPEAFGLEKIHSNIYVELNAKKEDKQKIIQALSDAQVLLKTVYGSVESIPAINVCITEECYESFGGMGSKAKIYGKYVLLSPRGIDRHYIAHEWSHLEIRQRLGLLAWYRLPQWFDEGLAVLVSDSPDHSEKHWEKLVEFDINRPTRSELMGLISLRDWLNAVKKYGSTKNAERKAAGEMEVRPVYTAAGNEVRLWFNEAKTDGLLLLISELKSGSRLNEIYK